jgi:hypothetical protein
VTPAVPLNYCPVLACMQLYENGLTIDIKTINNALNLLLQTTFNSACI